MRRRSPWPVPHKAPVSLWTIRRPSRSARTALAARHPGRDRLDPACVLHRVGGAIGSTVRWSQLAGRRFPRRRAGSLSVPLNSQTVDTDYAFAGAYSRYEWAAQYFDFTLQGGNADDKSRRLVLNDGAVHRDGHRELRRLVHQPGSRLWLQADLADGYLLTPTARIGYVAGPSMASRSGSAQRFSVRGRTFQGLRGTRRSRSRPVTASRRRTQGQRPWRRDRVAARRRHRHGRRVARAGPVVP